MRNPNGYGSVTKLSGNRRKPYVARKTVGYNEKGHPIYAVIGYYETKQEAMIALAEYNKNPWDIDKQNITFKEVYELFLKKKIHKFALSSQRVLKSNFNHTKPLWNMKYKDIKSYHMQDVIDNCGKSYSTQGSIKTLFAHLDKLALEMDVINKAYSQLTTSESIPDTKKTPFTEEEINFLWEHQNEFLVDIILIYLYTGFRRSELLEIEKKDIDLINKTIIGGIKTKSGKNRIIPIHHRIFPFIEEKMCNNKDFLFSNEYGTRLYKDRLYKEWNFVMKQYNMNHTIHECRHTFRSRLDSLNANKRCIDLLMGHKSTDVGERVYTHKTLEELRETIELLA